MQADKVVKSLRLALKIFVRVGTDDRIALRRGILLDAVEHGSIVVSDQIGHHNAYDAWCFLA